MLKWIGGGCLVLLVLVGVLSYAGYRKMAAVAAAGPAVTVTIAATPERIFASMTEADSLPTWRGQGMTIHTTRKGRLVAGDTIRLRSRRDSVAVMGWVVDTLVANQLVTSRLIMLQNGMVIRRQRDSLSRAGDSTRVTTTVDASMPRMGGADGRGGSGGLIDVAMTMGTASARLMAEQELSRLKARLEGRPVPGSGLKARTTVRPDTR